MSTNREPNANITITTPNHQAVLLGKEHVRVHLTPGNYVIAAKLAGNQATKVIHISKRKVTTVTINPADTHLLPTTADAGYLNFDQLSSNGLSDTQITYLRDMLNQFSPNAQSISLDPQSIQSIPHDPNSEDLFGVNFNLSIDGVNYKALAKYPDDQSIQLYLYDAQTGAQLYAGSEPSSPDS